MYHPVTHKALAPNHRVIHKALAPNHRVIHKATTPKSPPATPQATATARHSIRRHISNSSRRNPRAYLKRAAHLLSKTHTSQAPIHHLPLFRVESDPPQSVRSVNLLLALSWRLWCGHRHAQLRCKIILLHISSYAPMILLRDVALRHRRRNHHETLISP